MAVKTLMLLSENWELYDPRDLGPVIEAAKIAEAAGIDGIAISEHIVLGAAAGEGVPKFNPRENDMPGNQHPWTPWPSSIVLLSAIAAVTTRLELHAGALLPVLRHPLHSASDLATLDLLSKGRLVVWPTVSWHAQEYAALGQPFNKRGRMMDEILAIWRKAWAEGPVSFEGEFYNFKDVWVEPKPWRPEGPPIWITGDKLHEAALRRLVAHGSAFVPLGPVPPEDKERIRVAFAAAGRDPTALVYAGALMGQFDAPAGVADIEKSFATIAPQLAAGATVFGFKPSHFIERPDQLDGLCREIAARVRAASVEHFDPLPSNPGGKPAPL